MFLQGPYRVGLGIGSALRIIVEKIMVGTLRTVATL